MTQFTAASAHPLLQDWTTWVHAQEFTWASEWRTMAARAVDLACNDPFIAALVASLVQGTVGPEGLRGTSLYDPTPDQAGTNDATRLARRALTAILDASWSGRDFDAEGLTSRAEIEAMLAWMAVVWGEGFAIRVSRPGERSRWRVVTPDRVANPSGKANGADLRDGFRFVGGRLAGVYVSRAQIGAGGYVTLDPGADYIPWTAPDGTPNVVYRTGYRLAGMQRAVTRLAPMIVMSRQLHGVLESHVAGKRLQAIQAMIIEAEDSEAFKAAQATGNALDPYSFDVKGPLNLWVKQAGSGEVQFTDTKFNGADLKDYLIICYKVQSAAVVVPVDVVLCQLTDASLSSARAGLDQYDRTCQGEQARHIAQATGVFDQVEISDALVLGGGSIAGVPAGAALNRLAVAKHARPPKYSTDRQKDQGTIKLMVENGFSKTTAFATVGAVWEDEHELSRAEDEFEAVQGLEATKRKDATFVRRIEAAAEAIGASSINDLSWPIVVAAGAAETAPGAFIQALSKPDATGVPASTKPTPTPADEQGQPVDPEDQPAASVPLWRRLLSWARPKVHA